MISNVEDNDNDMSAVILAARQGADLQLVSMSSSFEAAFLPLGNSGQGELVDLEKFQARPRRKRGTLTVFDAASLLRVLANNADAGDATIYIDRDPEKPAIVAVMNGNGGNGSGWGDFRAEIEFRRTPQWLKWRAKDDHMFDQTSFAEFIENNLADIFNPPGATMLEIASYLQATKTTNFKSGIRLQDGNVQFQNMEDTQAQVGAGQIAVPEIFTLSLSPIMGVEPYAIPARFRYRIQDGKLRLGYKLQRIEDLMGQIVDAVVKQIADVVTADVSIVSGLPPDRGR